jgi:hypothetical protein
MCLIYSNRICVYASGALWLSLLSCTPKAEPITIGKILFNAPAEFDSALQDKKHLQEVFVGLIRKEPGINMGENSKTSTHRAIIKLEPNIELQDANSLGLSIYLESKGRAIDFVGVSESHLQGGLVPGAENLLAQAWQSLRQQRAITVIDDAALVKMLDSASGQLLIAVIEEIGRRRLYAATSTLCEKMKQTEDTRIALSMVGALVKIGDPAAVNSIITLSDQKSPNFMLPIIFAVAKLGGRSAEGFLLTLASGHPHPAIQKGAKDALEELKQAKRSPPQL